MELDSISKQVVCLCSLVHQNSLDLIYYDPKYHFLKPLDANIVE